MQTCKGIASWRVWDQFTEEDILGTMPTAGVESTASMNYFAYIVYKL